MGVWAPRPPGSTGPARTTCSSSRSTAAAGCRWPSPPSSCSTRGPDLRADEVRAALLQRAAAIRASPRRIGWSAPHRCRWTGGVAGCRGADVTGRATRRSSRVWCPRPARVRTLTPRTRCGAGPRCLARCSTPPPTSCCTRLTTGRAALAGAACWSTPDGGVVAVALVAHHVLADGMGGLRDAGCPRRPAGRRGPGEVDRTVRRRPARPSRCRVGRARATHGPSGSAASATSTWRGRDAARRRASTSSGLRRPHARRAVQPPRSPRRPAPPRAGDVRPRRCAPSPSARRGDRQRRSSSPP